MRQGLIDCDERVNSRVGVAANFDGYRRGDGRLLSQRYI